MTTKLKELCGKYADFGHEFNSFVLESRITQQQNELLWQMLNSHPIAVCVDRGYATELQWLSFGYRHAGNLKRLWLIDRLPIYNETRKLYYFFCRHGDKEFTPSFGFNDVPSAWVLPETYDRIDHSKPYHDAMPLGGWDSEESARQALGYGALQWALRKEGK